MHDNADTTPSTIAERFRKVAADFTARATATPHDAWDKPTPCEGWVARDIVRHLVEWVPAFLAASSELVIPTGLAVDTDPVGAWSTLNEALQVLLDNPATAGSTISHPMAGTHTLADAIGTFVLGDVLIHTWDLARAVGLDERLDADEVHRGFAEMEPLDEALRQSGHFGPRVQVPPDADEQTQLLAFMGRTVTVTR